MAWLISGIKLEFINTMWGLDIGVSVVVTVGCGGSVLGVGCFIGSGTMVAIVARWPVAVEFEWGGGEPG